MVTEDVLTYGDCEDAVLELSAEISDLYGQPVTGSQVWQVVREGATGRSVADLVPAIAGLATEVRQRRAEQQEHASVALSGIPAPAAPRQPGSGYPHTGHAGSVRWLTASDLAVLSGSVTDEQIIAQATAAARPDAAAEIERLSATEIQLSRTSAIALHRGTGDRPGRRGPAYGDMVSPVEDAHGAPADGGLMGVTGSVPRPEHQPREEQVFRWGQTRSGSRWRVSSARRQEHASPTARSCPRQ